MQENSTESVSALMDGEVDVFELRRTLQLMESDESCQQQWRRYHLARSMLRNEEASVCAIDISGSIMQRIANEQAQPELAIAVDEVQQASHKTLWKQLASMAVAASVTAVMILGYQSTQVSETSINHFASNETDYRLPRQQVANEYLPVQYGSLRLPSTPTVGAEPEVIRFSEGLERYIEQHRHLTAQPIQNDRSKWQADWLPKGFKQLSYEQMAHAEVMVFSDGNHTVSVCIEPLGRQRVPEGVASVGEMVAVGKRQHGRFITVVGDVPLMIAERIASSVKP